MNTIQFGRGRLVDAVAGNRYLDKKTIVDAVRDNPTIQAALEAASDKIELRLIAIPWEVRVASPKTVRRDQDAITCGNRFRLIPAIQGRGCAVKGFSINSAPVCPAGENERHGSWNRWAHLQLQKTVADVAEQVAASLAKLSRRIDTAIGPDAH